MHPSSLFSLFLSLSLLRARALGFLLFARTNTKNKFDHTQHIQLHWGRHWGERRMQISTKRRREKTNEIMINIACNAFSSSSSTASTSSHRNKLDKQRGKKTTQRLLLIRLDRARSSSSGLSISLPTCCWWWCYCLGSRWWESPIDRSVCLSRAFIVWSYSSSSARSIIRQRHVLQHVRFE